MQFNRCLKCMSEIESYPCPHCGLDPRTYELSDQAIRPGTILNNRYIVGCVLGQGGFGITYVAWDLVLERKSAVKEYFPSGQVMRDRDSGTSLIWSNSEQARQMRMNGVDNVLKEARKMALVSDIPEVVNVKDAFRMNDTAYIVMDFVEGETLKDRLKRCGPMSWSEAKAFFSAAILAMQKVHDEGLIHRDISPDNIMITNKGDLKILDLGAAKDLNRNQGVSSMLVAKKGYSPVEQYNERGNSGPWTDVYAMAATIYYSLTMARLQESYDRLYEDQVDWNLPALKDIPRSALNAIRHGMGIRIQDRTQSMSQLLQELLAGDDSGRTAPTQTMGSGRTPRPAPPKFEKDPGRKKKKKSVLPIILLVVLLMTGVALGGVLMLVRPWESGKPAEPQNAATVQTPPAADETVPTVPETTVAPPATEQPTWGASAETTPAPTVATEPAAAESVSAPGKVLNIPALTVSECTMPRADIRRETGTLTEKGQKAEYYYTPAQTGTCRLEVNGMVSGMNVYLRVFDNLGNKIHSNDYCKSGDGITMQLTAGETYRIQLELKTGSGNYELMIGSKKAVEDVTGRTVIYDRVEYTGQRTGYTFTPPLDGFYQIWLEGMPNGTRVKLIVTDNLENVVAEDSYCNNGGIQVKDMKAGSTYRIQINQSSGLMDYKLCIGYQKATVDITGAAEVCDSIEYTNQRNWYTFTAPMNGIYRFDVSEFHSNVRFKIYIYDDLNNTVGDNTYVKNGDGATVTLEGGKTYRILLRQYEQADTYKLTIGYQQPVRTVTPGTRVTGSLTYRDQVNEYSLTADRTGKIRVTGCEIRSDVYFDVSARNYLNEQLDRHSGFRNEKYITFDVEAGSTYTIRIKGNIGSYGMNIEYLP